MPSGTSVDVEVSNFGPISRGKFSIKPLTVFVGPNNSGKTYAALLAHSLLSPAHMSTRWEIADWIKPHLRSKTFKQAIAEMEKLALSAVGKPQAVPAKYSNLARSVLLEHSLKLGLLASIKNNFNTDTANLVRAPTRSSRIKMSHGLGVHLALHRDKAPELRFLAAHHPYAIKNLNGRIRIFQGKHRHDHKGVLAHRATPIDLEVDAILESLGKTASLGLRAFLSLALWIEHSYAEHSPRSCYLPAARAGILSAYETIVSSVVQNAKYAGTREMAQTSQLPGSTSDFLAFLVNSKPQARNGSGNGKTMIADMFGGSIVISKPRAGLPQIMYRHSGMEIPLNRSASGITETAPLQMLQDNVREYDVLVLEEPEAHLHPKNQTKLAKHIVRFVKNGVRVILITHGVFFLEQLSMFVKMSKMPAEARRKLGYDDDDFISDSDVAPYMFVPNAKGGYSMAELEHSASEGISQDEFSKITEYMYEEDLEIERAID